MERRSRQILANPLVYTLVAAAIEDDPLQSEKFSRIACLAPKKR